MCKLASIKAIRKFSEIGSIDTYELLFTGQRVRRNDGTITVSQELAVEAVHEVALATGMKDSQLLPPELHTEYRSVRGAVNWLQSRAQFRRLTPLAGVHRQLRPLLLRMQTHSTSWWEASSLTGDFELLPH